MEFELPSQGVWLLTAENGGGKTSLLACLRRIGYRNAFPVHFPVSVESTNLDDYNGASVTYVLDEEEVEYAYRGERWAPRPRKNSQLLSRFGYPEVIYHGANAERITPRPEDFSPRKIKAASTKLIEAANAIFETSKFDGLRVVNLTRGNGNQVFVLKVSDGPAKYHSEKNFSLGELCILKLVEGIKDCPNQSLVLIDELEMALHPRAQVQLYKYLVKVAKAKRLTVIFSTHSISLLKAVHRSKILYLERASGGVVSVVKGCFPTYAIGAITLGEENAPDAVFYVEDEVAKAILEPLVKLVLQEKFAASSLFPDVRVVPIGGFDAVVQFLTHHSVLLPANTKACAMLDADVRDEIVADWRTNNNHQRLADFDQVTTKLDYLPWTPEVGILEYLRNSRQAETSLRTAIGRPSFALHRQNIGRANGLVGKELRQAAKVILQEVATTISQLTGQSIEDARKIICSTFSVDEFERRKSEIMQLIAPKIG
jgi:hypothetical protein